VPHSLWGLNLGSQKTGGSGMMMIIMIPVIIIVMGKAKKMRSVVN